MVESEGAPEPGAGSYSRRRSVEFEVSQEEITAAYLAQANEMRPTFKAPGFRPGKVSAEFIVGRMSGEMRAQIVQGLLLTRMNQEIPEADRGSLLDAPHIRVHDRDGGETAPIRATVEYELMPEVPPLALESLTFERVEPELGDEAVRRHLCEMLETTPFPGEPEPDRAAAEGDFVELDWVLTVQGREFQRSDENTRMRTRASASAEEGSGERMALGLASGAEFTTQRVFEKTVRDPRLRGARGTYRCTVVAVRPPRPPAVDEETGKSLGFESVEDLMEWGRQTIRQRHVRLQRRYYRRQFYRQLSETEIDLDPERVRRTALEIRYGDDASPSATEGGNASDEPSGDGSAQASDGESASARVTPEDLAEAEGVLRYQLQLRVLNERLGIELEPMDLPRAAIGWERDPEVPENRLRLQEAVRQLSQSPELRAATEQSATAERILDEVLSKAQFSERKMRVDELARVVRETDSAPIADGDPD